jgi:hypothetical protein
MTYFFEIQLRESAPMSERKVGNRFKVIMAKRTFEKKENSE